jgi:hypothetical protein
LNAKRAKLIALKNVARSAYGVKAHVHHLTDALILLAERTRLLALHFFIFDCTALNQFNLIECKKIG